MRRRAEACKSRSQHLEARRTKTNGEITREKEKRRERRPARIQQKPLNREGTSEGEKKKYKIERQDSRCRENSFVQGKKMIGNVYSHAGLSIHVSLHILAHIRMRRCLDRETHTDDTMRREHQSKGQQPTRTRKHVEGKITPRTLEKAKDTQSRPKRHRQENNRGECMQPWPQKKHLL